MVFGLIIAIIGLCCWVIALSGVFGLSPVDEITLISYISPFILCGGVLAIAQHAAVKLKRYIFATILYAMSPVVLFAMLFTSADVAKKVQLAYGGNHELTLPQGNGAVYVDPEGKYYIAEDESGYPQLIIIGEY